MWEYCITLPLAMYSKVETGDHLSISMVMPKDKVFQQLSVSSEISTLKIVLWYLAVNTSQQWWDKWSQMKRIYGELIVEFYSQKSSYYFTTSPQIDRFREVKRLAQSHTASSEQSQKDTVGLQALGTMLCSSYHTDFVKCWVDTAHK